MPKRKPYQVCPECGCALDHGEHCECERRQEEAPPVANHKRLASQRRAYERYLEERQQEWLYS